jgi:hypothetical protein
MSIDSIVSTWRTGPSPSRPNAEDQDAARGFFSFFLNRALAPANSADRVILDLSGRVTFPN